jgi:hypothetical protein
MAELQHARLMPFVQINGQIRHKRRRRGQSRWGNLGFNTLAVALAAAIIQAAYDSYVAYDRCLPNRRAPAGLAVQRRNC